jgi:membrane protein implicated in regulation of membrane protease activity
MSTYEQIVGLPLCGGLTALGLFLSYLVVRRRGLGSGLRVAAWSLLPLAAYLTGSVPMFWKIGVAIGDFAKGFVFSPKVWAGVALAGVAVVLLMVARPLRKRSVAGGQDKQSTGSAQGATRTLPAATGTTGTTGRQLATRPDPAAPAKAPAAASATAPPKARRGKNADDDDDLGDVEDILRRHGIT